MFGLERGYVKRVLCAPAAAFLAMALLSGPAGTVAYAQGAPPTLVSVDSVRQMEFHDQVNLVGRTAARVDSRIVAEVLRAGP